MKTEKPTYYNGRLSSAEAEWGYLNLADLECRFCRSNEICRVTGVECSVPNNNSFCGTYSRVSDLEETEFKALVYNGEFVGARLFFDDGTVGDLGETEFKSVFKAVDLACFDKIIKLEDFNGTLMTSSEHRSGHSVRDLSDDVALIRNLQLAFEDVTDTMFILTETVKFIRAEELTKKLNDSAIETYNGFQFVMDWDYYNELIDKDIVRSDCFHFINSKIRVFYDYYKRKWKYTDSKSF